MVAGVAVAQGIGPGSVAGNHAAHGASGGTGRVGGEATAAVRQARVELATGHARLHADGVGTDFENGAEMTAEIDDQPAAEGFAGQTGAGAGGIRGRRCSAA